MILDQDVVINVEYLGTFDNTYIDFSGSLFHGTPLGHLLLSNVLAKINIKETIVDQRSFHMLEVLLLTRNIPHRFSSNLAYT